jgi:hypothetical protein
MRSEVVGWRLGSRSLPGVECLLDLHHVEAIVIVFGCTCQSIQEEKHHFCVSERIFHGVEEVRDRFPLRRYCRDLRGDDKIPSICAFLDGAFKLVGHVRRCLSRRTGFRTSTYSDKRCESNCPHENQIPKHSLLSTIDHPVMLL